MLAVYVATSEAVERARRGEGPTLIEAMTYRIGAHSTADDAGRYRDDADVEAARMDDPIARFRTWMMRTGAADDAFLARCDAEAEATAMKIREGVIATPAPPVEWMFDWLYAAPAPSFERQRDEAIG